MLFYIIDYFRKYFNYDKIDIDIQNIKNKLKKTNTLKRQFYNPTLNDINNKIFMINLKKKIKINVNDLIIMKTKLKKI